MTELASIANIGHICEEKEFLYKNENDNGKKFCLLLYEHFYKYLTNLRVIWNVFSRIW